MLAGMAKEDIWDVVEVTVKTLVYGAVIALIVTWAPWHRISDAYGAWREGHPSIDDRIQKLSEASAAHATEIEDLKSQLAACRKSHVTINYR
jgi:hypothetical protein